MSFSFSFSGDDIEDDGTVGTTPVAAAPPATATPASSAFPVQGKPQLPPQRHDLKEMLAQLPSKIAYNLLDVTLDTGDALASQDAPFRLSLPRRELWDVKVQLMAEEGDGDDDDDKNGTGELAPGLGTHDVKTGIYEGGFKSWESSVDLVKVLLQPPAAAPGAPAASTPQPSPVAASVLQNDTPSHVIELGCGTALPSLALFHWASATAGDRKHALTITVADYNPSVLFLVTLPNFILAWALQQRDASPLLQQAIAVDDDDGDDHGELDLTDDVKAAFCAFLAASNVSLAFLSGGWSPAFVELLYGSDGSTAAVTETAATSTLVLGAETIYSPFALESFSVTLLSILRRSVAAAGIVGAKKLYFGVGGSLDDFVLRMRDAGATVAELREEADGVRRGVVQCVL